LEDGRNKMMWFEVNIVWGKCEGRKRGEMTEYGIEAVAEFVMKGEFRVTDAIEEVIAKGVKAGAAGTLFVLILYDTERSTVRRLRTLQYLLTILYYVLTF
jgi:hypothetical protein